MMPEKCAEELIELLKTASPATKLFVARMANNASNEEFGMQWPNLRLTKIYDSINKSLCINDDDS